MSFYRDADLNGWRVLSIANLQRWGRHAGVGCVISLTIYGQAAKADLVLVVQPAKVNGLLVDMYIDTAKVTYDYPKRLVRVGSLTNVGSSPPSSQRYVTVMNCETGGQHITGRIMHTGPMGTGFGQEIPDTPDSLVESFPPKESMKGQLHAGLCKRLLSSVDSK